MVSKKFVIENEQGLHMRPAGVLAKAVTKFESDVTIVFEDKKINAKSLLNIIGACNIWVTSVGCHCVSS